MTTTTSRSRHAPVSIRILGLIAGWRSKRNIRWTAAALAAALMLAAEGTSRTNWSSAPSSRCSMPSTNRTLQGSRMDSAREHGNSERPLPPVRLLDVRPPYRLGSVRSPF